MTSNAKINRRSLKECFRNILQRRQDDQDLAHEDRLTTRSRTSRTLKSCNPSLALLPHVASLSSLPHFDSRQFTSDQYGVSIPDRHEGFATGIWAADSSQHTIIPYSSPSSSGISQIEVRKAYQYQSQLGQLAKSCSIEQDWLSKSPNADRYGLTQIDSLFSRETLTSDYGSLSSLVSPNLVQHLSPLGQLVQAYHVPSVYRHGASLQASLATLDSRAKSASTLRLQRSTQDLKPVQDPGRASQPHRRASTSPVLTSRPDLMSRPNLSADNRPSQTPSPEIPSSVSSSKSASGIQHASEVDIGIASLKHFASFCVLDAASPGCPVTAMSQDLREVLDVGEEFFVDTAGVDGASMETITGQDADGNVIVHLVVHNPLVNPNSGRSRFVLASVVDITAFITDPSLPDLETISEESVAEEDLKTPTRPLAEPSPRYMVSRSEALEGHVSPTQDILTATQPQKDDVWLDIATEEIKRSRSVKPVPSTPRSCSIVTSSSSLSMAEVMDQFLVELQNLYSEFFLLGKSPLDENTYEICNVSPKVHASREYVEGHLSKTPRADKELFERQLTKDQSFQMQVRWGAAGEPKQIFCIPLFGRSNITWVCFLVEEGTWMGLPLWK